ncbi:hypothetical protein XH99_21035 [Bradyrhizobium nanningense]|uniref:Uncharacterized protein n=1 Tax=Bradyrhizobium nanningense TaxID=1325118 RepID=A0A4Q0S1M4_9BRAD|nr:hypothetical protein XH99_21035 [Bradyrhizobium nanningense]RXH29646.1 hypothetical protein XH84_21845 [Bradyrhizobium nanningense]
MLPQEIVPLAPLLARLHEDHATTMSREFGGLFRTSLHKLPHFVATREIDRLNAKFVPWLDH